MEVSPPITKSSRGQLHKKFSKLSAYIMQYNRQDGLVSSKLKTRFQLAIGGGIILCGFTVYSSFKLLTYNKIKDEGMIKHFRKSLRTTSFSLLIVLGILSHTCYSVYKLIPQDNITENMNFLQQNSHKTREQIQNLFDLQSNKKSTQ